MFETFTTEIIDPLLIFQDWGRSGYITNMYVTHDYRRRGLGNRMLLQTQEWLKSRGVTRVMLNVSVNNEKGSTFWKGQGFEPVLIACGRISALVRKGINHLAINRLFPWLVSTFPGFCAATLFSSVRSQLFPFFFLVFRCATLFSFSHAHGGRRLFWVTL